MDNERVRGVRVLREPGELLRGRAEEAQRAPGRDLAGPPSAVNPCRSQACMSHFAREANRLIENLLDKLDWLLVVSYKQTSESTFL